MAILKRVTGDPSGQLIELKTDVTVIGRLPECQIVLDPNGVSRRHAEIRRTGSAFVVADLGSRNKTLLNDNPLRAGQEHALKTGDRINICDVEFVFYPAAPPPGRDSERPKP